MDLTEHCTGLQPCRACRLAPDILEILVGGFCEPGAGRDWEHFSTGLGTGLPAREKIRIKQGENIAVGSKIKSVLFNFR